MGKKRSHYANFKNKNTEKYEMIDGLFVNEETFPNGGHYISAGWVVEDLMKLIEENKREDKNNPGKFWINFSILRTKESSEARKNKENGNSQPKETNNATDVPEINYESEIKPQDLPF